MFQFGASVSVCKRTDKPQLPFMRSNNQYSAPLRHWELLDFGPIPFGGGLVFNLGMHSEKAGEAGRLDLTSAWSADSERQCLTS